MDKSDQPCPGPLPGDVLDPDPEWAEYSAWVDREVAAGHDVDGPEPEVWELGDWQSLDTGQVTGVFLPAVPVPTGPPGEGRGLRFGQGDEADLLPPGPALLQLTEQAVRAFDQLSDDELVGVLRAARRQEAREQYKQVLVMAEFGRRRLAEFQDARGRGAPPGRRPGEFPGEELAIELVTTRGEAANRIENAAALVTRLPATLAGMAAGLVDETRANCIACYTHSLSPDDAARADEILAAAAPDLRADQLARKAAALEMKLAPEAVKARKEHARNTAQRVEARREDSGNASLAAREMATADAVASKAYIDALAARLRNGGLTAPIGSLRVLVMSDLTQGRNPLDRLRPAAGRPGPGYAAPDGQPGWTPEEAETARYHDPLADDLDETRRGPIRPGDPVPLPALINLLVPAGTLLGWSAAPAQAGTWGLLDHDEATSVVTAAAQHPRTRWCVTLTNEQGEAVAHGCARGQHPKLLSDLGPQPPPAQLAELVRRLNLTFEPIARGSCDHARAEARYAPSRSLRHLVRARTDTCDAPGCGVPAIHADLDHTVPHPEGPTCQCNLGPKCRTHHRVKQAPGWTVEQTEPGVIRWMLPSGRTHVTRPARYDL